MKRTYTSPLRQAQAAQTRASIIEAARQLFDAHGYAATTLDQIAARAGISPNTVYAVFRTKTAILHAILQRVSPEDVVSGAVASALEAASPREQLRRLLDRFVALNSADDGVFSIAASAALTDLDAAEWWETAQNGEWHALHDLAARWVREGRLREGLSAEDATNSLWAMTRPSLIRSFVHDCGWTAERAAEWLTTALENALLDEVAAARPAPRRAAPAAKAAAAPKAAKSRRPSKDEEAGDDARR